MRRIAKLGTIVGAAMLTTVAANAQNIVVGNASGDPGTSVTVSVSLTTGTASIAGTENVIAFTADAKIAARANMRPDCSANAEIDKSATSFAFQPAGCAATSSCTAVKAIVLSTSNVDPIPTGSVLYTCKVDLAVGASGAKALTCSAPGGSDPDGNAITTTCDSGTVTIGGGDTPTPGGGTPTPTAEPRPTPPLIEIGTATLTAPGTANVDVLLETGTASIAGTENVITFGSGVRVQARANGRPNCTANAEIDKSATSFAFQPAGCTGAACTAVKAIVLSTSNVDPIPNGAVLFTCVVDATSSGALTCSAPGGSDPDGNATALGCVSGRVDIGGGGDTPTPTEPVANTPTPTNTIPVPTVTNTVPVPTRTNTVPPAPTATNTRVPSTGSDEDDGCQISAPTAGSNGWMLLIPAAALLWVRRRSR